MHISNNAIAILDEMINQGGLPYVGSQMEQKIGYPIQIADRLGQVHYPVLTQDSLPLDKSFLDVPLDRLYINLPTLSEEDCYSYSEDNQQFYYRLRFGETICYIFIESLPCELIPCTIDIIKDSDLAMKWYFSGFAKITKINRLFEKELMEYFFFKGDSNTKDLFKINNENYDSEKPYYIELIEFDKAENNIQKDDSIMQLIRSYALQYCKRDCADALPIVWYNRLLLMIPCAYKKDTPILDEEWPKYEHCMLLKQELDTKFKMVSSMGIGRVYKLKDIQKSFVEASIVLSLLKFLDKKGTVQKFSDLGLFALIFPLDIIILREYCNKTIGKLIINDKKNNGQLLPTLEMLVKSKFNNKLTADRLFIHPNTLYYRISKIEQLLNLDLSDMNNCFELFAVNVVYHTLKDNDWIKLQDTI